MTGRITIKAVMVVALVGCALLSASFLHDRPLLMSDTLTYVEGARSLAHGDGYSDRDGHPITVRPPGYSVVLAPLVWAGADSMRNFKAVNIVLAVAAIGMFAVVLGSIAGRWLGLLVAVACGVSFPWIYYSHAVLSEMLFTFLLAAFIAAAMRQMERPGKVAWAILVAVTAALPVVRFAGVAVLPVCACVIWFSSAKEGASPWKRLALVGGGLAVALGPAALFFLRNMAASGQWSSYETTVSPEYALTVGRIGINKFNLLTQIWINARGYLHIFLVPDQAGIARVSLLPWWARLASSGAWVVAMVGVVRAMRSVRGRVLSLTCICYGGLLMLNTWYDIRYLLPVIPIFFWFLADGSAFLTTWVASRIGLRPTGVGRFLVSPGVLAGTLLALVFVGNMAFILTSGKSAKLRSAQYTGVVQRMHNAAMFTADRPEEGAVLVAGGAGFVRLWSGRRVVNALSWLDADRKLTVESLPDDITFVLLDENEFAPYRQKYLEPLVEANREALELAFQAEQTLVYKRREIMCSPQD